MSWAVGYDDQWQRDIGYGVPSICDHPGCSVRIDRSLAHVCGGEPYGGEHGCGLYFCDHHLILADVCSQQCEACFEMDGNEFTPTPDLPEWIEHKTTDPTWAAWRASQSAKEVKP
jgi:hypothetical protein